MKITKRVLGHLPSCYAAGAVPYQGGTMLLLAPDAPGPCYAFDSVSFRQETVWEEPGGTMAIVPVPGGSGAFLAVQRFFPGFKAEGAELARVKHENGKWRTETLCKLPFLHRFLILERGGIKYLLCATLCTTKKNEADWSSPGGLYAAELPADLGLPVSPIKISGGMTRNHGCWHVQNKEYDYALTSCDEGVYEVRPPEERGGKWEVEQILDQPVSDIALADIDGDGEDEMAAIEPFHGSSLVIYKKSGGGYTPIYSYPVKTEFLHTIWGGKLRGQAVFIGGARGGSKELFLLRYGNGKISHEILETGAGPANVCVINGKDRDLILTANHEGGEGAVFTVTDDQQ